MSNVRKFRPDTRLSNLMAEPGGLRASDAIRRADENLASVRDVCVAALDAEIAALQDFAQNQSRDGLPAAYRAAREIFAIGGTYGLTELSAAAHSLCELLSKGNLAAGAVPWACVRVHVDAMKRLRHPSMEGNGAARAALIEGLRKVSTQGE